MRRTDTIFRWGGEEFLIVLEGINIEMGLYAMEKIRKGIEEATIAFDGKEIKLTVTVGINALNNADPYASIAKSDEKMYKGKQNNKNQVVAYL